MNRITKNILLLGGVLPIAIDILTGTFGATFAFFDAMKEAARRYDNKKEDAEELIGIREYFLQNTGKIMECVKIALYGLPCLVYTVFDRFFEPSSNLQDNLKYICCSIHKDEDLLLRWGLSEHIMNLLKSLKERREEQQLRNSSQNNGELNNSGIGIRRSSQFDENDKNDNKLKDHSSTNSLRIQ